MAVYRTTAYTNRYYLGWLVIRNEDVCTLDK